MYTRSAVCIFRQQCIPLTLDELPRCAAITAAAGVNNNYIITTSILYIYIYNRQ